MSNNSLEQLLNVVQVFSTSAKRGTSLGSKLNKLAVEVIWSRSVPK